MKFYMIQDLNSKLWYKRGSFGGSWVKQDRASVWTTPAGPSAAKGNITSYNKRLILYNKNRSHENKINVPEPEIHVLDTEVNPALDALRGLYEVIDLEAFITYFEGFAKKSAWRQACAQAARLI